MGRLMRYPRNIFYGVHILLLTWFADLDDVLIIDLEADGKSVRILFQELFHVTVVDALFQQMHGLVLDDKLVHLFPIGGPIARLHTP